MIYSNKVVYGYFLGVISIDHDVFVLLDFVSYVMQRFAEPECLNHTNYTIFLNLYIEVSEN